MNLLRTISFFFSLLIPGRHRSSESVPAVLPDMLSSNCLPEESLAGPVDFSFVDLNDVRVSSHLRDIAILEHEVGNMITIIEGNLDNVRPYSLAAEVDQFREYIQSHFSGNGLLFPAWSNSFRKNASSDICLAERESRKTAENLVNIFSAFRNSFLGDGFLGKDVRAEASYKTIRSNLKGIIDHLERFSQNSEISFVGNPEPAKVCKQITHLLSSLDVFSEQREISLRMSDHTNAENDVTVNIDKHLFRNAILNLLSNSEKAAKKVDYPVQCSIEICLSPTNQDRVFITISDNGTGIPAEILPVIFDEGCSTTLGDSKGRIGGVNKGLGLSIVKNTIEAAGGTISVLSSTDLSNHHTAFVIDLPRVLDLDALIDLAGIKSSYERRPTSKTPVIYFLEDESAISEPTTYRINREFPGVQVIVFTDTKDLYNHIRKAGSDELPHVVIADMNVLGSVTGDDLIRIMDGSNFRGIKYIYSTAGNENPVFKLSGDDLVVSVSKPYSPMTKLINQIRTFLVEAGLGIPI